MTWLSMGTRCKDAFFRIKKPLLISFKAKQSKQVSNQLKINRNQRKRDQLREIRLRGAWIKQQVINRSLQIETVNKRRIRMKQSIFCFKVS